MTRAQDIKKLRALLARRRRDILETSRSIQREVEALKEQEKDPEYEEGAQVELADYTLSHLAENQRRELMLIDAALQRMDAGEYGICVDCDMDIPFERLEAVPYALRCEEDAERQEFEQRHRGMMATPSL
jgi:DnaK suppressor protein